ncbi:hypothetical protein LEP1GSC072_1993 [Leptospira noguchii str. Bonito]|nr:hypothetical protein LEP1GSC072_1993 [Leptospira noguchii str. Bonito]
MNELSVSLPELSTTLSMDRVVESSYWYFIKIESDSGISQ